MRIPSVALSMILVVAVATVANVAHADPIALASNDGLQRRIHHRDRGTAYTMTVLATMGSLVTITVAGLSPDSRAQGGAMLGGLGLLFLAPSIGHIYANDWITPGLLLRVGGVALAAVSLYNNVLEEPHDPNSLGLAGVGVGAIIGGAIWDFATVGSAVDDFNEAHQLRLAPTVMATPHGMVGGFGLTARF